MTITNFLIGLVAFVLLLIIIGQIGRVSEMISGVSKSDDDEYEDTANINGLVFFLVGIIGLGLIAWSYFAQKGKYLPSASSELGRQWDFLFYKVFTPPILLVFFITHILLFYFAYKYRFKKNRKAFYFSHSNKLEIIWTSIPLFTMIVLGALTIPKWVQATAKPGPDALHVKVTGQQFKWHVAYAGADNQFGSRNIRDFGSPLNNLGLDPTDDKGYDDVYASTDIVIPVGREISFDLSALDVLHDFYLPHFRVKMDCVPGVPTRIKIIPDVTTAEMREKLGDPNFDYEVACAELCGSAHWNMRRVLKVVEPEEFNAWLNEQVPAKEVYYNTLIEEYEKEKIAKAELESQEESGHSSEHGDSHATSHDPSHTEESDTHINEHSDDSHDETEIHDENGHDEENLDTELEIEIIEEAEASLN